ncbi:hypothetical protein [Sandaracinus amylolyticus]|uniref:Uncharacterized protein n=1 Tax=Sandaracinus amylolyticus TaxID=927083 RepID=A0A0F6W9P5_9BACT|nr:hypothetical protein [Sandaracinus amylolyticus]AKF11018.1 hypothetical protein DB32_008167 [Sandaracinus amylolyticus]
MNESTLAIATQLATAHPESALPCPACGASVHGKNLAPHLATVHRGLAMVGGPPALGGADGRVVVVAAIPFALAALLLGAAVVLADVREDVAGGTLAGLVIGYLAVVGLAWLGVLRARLELDGDEVRLRYALGLLVRRVRLPATVEVGARVMTLGDSSPTPGEEVRVGSYLRLGDALTIGAPKGTGTRSHWTRWRQGSARSRCDITIDRLATIALEYHLASRGALTPRG